jgi:hypothetical protein
MAFFSYNALHPDEKYLFQDLGISRGLTSKFNVLVSPADQSFVGYGDQ